MFAVWKRRMYWWLFSDGRKLLKELHSDRSNIGSELQITASSKYGGIEYEVKERWPLKLQ
jgi:hypothetical protein